jgi:hypothetical protein
MEISTFLLIFVKRITAPQVPIGLICSIKREIERGLGTGFAKGILK